MVLRYGYGSLEVGKMMLHYSGVYRPLERQELSSISRAQSRSGVGGYVGGPGRSGVVLGWGVSPSVEIVDRKGTLPSAIKGAGAQAQTNPKTIVYTFPKTFDEILGF